MMPNERRVTMLPNDGADSRRPGCESEGGTGGKGSERWNLGGVRVPDRTWKGAPRWNLEERECPTEPGKARPIDPGGRRRAASQGAAGKAFRE